MRRWLKAFGIISFAVVMLVVISLFLPDHVYQRAAERITHLLTDRDLHIGSIRIQRGLQTNVELSDISLSNAEWSDRSTMLKADRLTASINLRALVQGTWEISSLTSSGLKLHLEKSKQGQSNWQLSDSSPSKSEHSRIKLIELSASNNLIEYIDQAADLQHKLELQSLDFKAENGGRIPELAARGVVNGFPVAIDTVAHNPEALKSRVENLPSARLPFYVKGSIGDLVITASGDVDTANSNAIVDSEVSLHVDKLQKLGKLIKADLPAFGSVDVSAHVKGDLSTVITDGVELSTINIRLDDEKLNVKGRGSFVGVPLDTHGDMQVNITALDNSDLLRVAGVNRPLPGQTHVEAMLHIDNKHVDISVDKAHVESDLFNFHLSGKLTDALGVAQASIDVDFEAPDMSLITHLYEQSMPPEWRSVSASGQLVGSNGQYALNQIVAKMNDKSTATATGSIGNLMPFDNMQLDVNANLFSLAEVSAFTTKPLPDIGPMSGNGEVLWKDGELSLLGAKANYSGPLGIAVVTGRIGDLMAFDKVRLRADANLPDFKALDLFTGFTMPAVDSVIVSSNLFSTEAMDLSARNLKVTARQDNVNISAEGSVDSIIQNNAIVNLNLKTQIDSTRQLDRLVNSELPDVGPMSATAKLLGSGEDIKLHDVEVTLNDPSLSGSVSSDVGYLNRLKTLSFDANLKTDSVKNTLAKFGISTDVNDPATLSSQVLLNVNENSVKLHKAQLKLADNSLTAELELLNVIDPEKRPRITGSINLLDWNITQVRYLPMARHSNSDKPESTDTTSKLLPDDPLPLGFIANNDLNLKIQIGEFISALFDVTDATLDLHSENGLLTVGPFSGKVNEGQANFHMNIDTNQNPTAVKLTADLENFDLARAGLLQSTNFIENTGGTNFKLTLDGHGESIAEILGSANGEGGLYIEDLVLKEGMLHILSSDILDQLVNALNPSKKRNKQTRLICSALTFQLKDGTLTTPMGFAVDADNFAILGEGKINFSDESIKVMIDSKPKKGLGFGLNKFVNLIEIEGQLAAPQLSLSKTGLLRLGATLAAALASGGLTLLGEGLMDKQLANSDVCAQALTQ